MFQDGKYSAVIFDLYKMLELVYKVRYFIADNVFRD